jgi:arylsulfatase
MAVSEGSRAPGILAGVRRPRAAPLVALAVGALLATLGPPLLGVGCGEGPARSPASAPLAGWNLVLVVIDTLRADHLGHAGYRRATSPFLDRLAAEGVVFENALSNSSFTRESVAALLTGHLPSRSGSAGWHAAPPQDGPHLGALLRGAGYRSAFLSNTLMLRAPGFTRGFDEVQHLPRRWDVSGAGPQLSRRAGEFVRGAPRPFLLYLHYLDPHAPYEPDPEDLARVAGQAPGAGLDLYRDVLPRLPSLLGEGFGPGEARFEELVARYDAEILGTDAALALLFDQLGAAGALERTLVVVTADHGEEFLEHGFLDHGWTLHQESIHVPLLFWAPGALAPARVTERVSHVDVLPSLLALLGVAAPEGEQGGVFDGVPLFDPEPPLRPHARERAHVAELLVARRQVLRAALLGDWKYVAAWRSLEPERRLEGQRADPPPAAELRGPPRREALYHLGEDPGETRDRLADAPEMGTRLRKALAAHLARGATGAATPEPAPPLDVEEAERLRALGYFE